MLPLRHRWLWRLSGWAMVIGVVVASVSPAAALNLSGSDKAMHAVTYFVLMIWFSGFYARRQQGVVALYVLTLGFALEMIQWRLPHRFFEPADMLANAVGVFVGFCLSVWLLAGWCQRLESRLRYHG